MDNNPLPSFDKAPGPQKPAQPAPLVDTDSLIAHNNQLPPLPPMKTAKRSHKGLWAFVLVLLILGLGGFGGWSYWQTMQLQDQVNQKQTQIDSLNSEKAKLEQDADKDVEDLTPAPTAEQQAELAANAAVAAGVSGKDMTAEITKLRDGFALAEVKNKDPNVDTGFDMILKKTNDIWVEVWRGQDRTATDKQNLNKAYGVPEDF
jgi:cell division protein FtsB